MMPKEIISTDQAPQAIGPYSQAVVASGPKMMFVSGQIPMDAETGNMAEATIKAQTTQVLKNIQGILRAANADFPDVVKTTVFLKDMGDFTGMNEVYAEFFESPFPARAAVEVARLPKDVLVEIECIVMIP